MAELEDFRRSPEEMVDFFQNLDINEKNYSLYERTLRYPDNAYVATMNAIKDEKMDIIDTSPKFEGLMENIKTKNNGEIPSTSQEGADKLNTVSKDLSNFLNNNSVDSSERDKAREISNFSQTLASNLVEESDIEDPYIIVDKDSRTKDFRKAASLYLLIKIFPDKDEVERNPDLSEEENFVIQENHASGKLVMNLLCPNITDEDRNSDEFFNRFKDEIFTSFEYTDKDEVKHTVSYKDLMTICDEVVKEKIDKIN